MAESKVEGSTYVSRSVKKKNEEERHVGGEYESTGEFATQDVPADVFPIRVSSGRTIQTAKFAFARITFTMEASVGMDDALRDEAYDRIREIVGEVLEREAAGLRKEDRKQNSLVDIEGEIRLYERRIRFEYGLTIPLPNYESRKVDIGRTEPVSDDEALEDAMQRVQTWVLTRLDAEQRKILGGDGDGYDIGF